jgi:hypothetical protein
MAKITQYSRISHHTISGSASAGLTFSVPAQEDFTDGTWTAFDLALSEIGVNEQDDKVYIRIDDEIKEFAFIGASGVGFTGGSGSCITDFYTQNIFACDGQLINLRTNNTISTFVDNTSDGFQFTIDAGYSSILLRANNVPLTDICEIQLSPLIGSPLQISKSDVPTGKSGQINIFSDNIQTIVGDIGVLDTTQINLSLTSSYWEQSDGTFYRNAIDFNTTDILFKAEDITNVLYGELQLTHNVTYFAHYNNGLLSLIQAQDDTINIQTQNGNVLNQIEMNSSNALSALRLSSVQGSTSSRITLNPESIQIEAPRPGTRPSLEIVVGPDNIKLGRGTGISLIHDFSNGSTTGATATTISVIDFSFGVFDKVITVTANINGIGRVVNLGYGAKLFAVFKNIGGTITQVSTTDKIEKTDFTTATSDIVISGTNIAIQVTGEVGTDIDWQTNFSYHIS